MKTLALLIPYALVATTLAAAREGQAQVPEPARAAYSQTLSTYVKAGRVDYAGLAKSGRTGLEAYVKALATADVPGPRNQRLGFYIDAYNALVLWAVIKNGRPRSVLDVDGFFDTAVHTVAGKSVTLDTLEKKILNPFAKDPRTHFVLVCGAVGCPILESKPYYGTSIDQRMERATRRYLSTPYGARVKPNELSLSKIFDWYAADFGGPSGVQAFVRARLSDAERDRLGDSPRVIFHDYNWTLNQR